jgi:hypothetical protein
MALVPIIYMKTVIESLINLVGTDISDNIANGTENQSFLYKVWNNITDDKFDFYSEAKGIFSRSKYSPNKLNVSLQYNKNLNAIPNIWLREPARRSGNYNSIGSVGEGEIIGGEFQPEYRDTKASTYELVVSSNNTLSTILVCETLYQVMLGAHDTLSDIFPQFSFSMKELMANNEITPVPVIMKSIEISTQMEVVAPSIMREQIVNAINFTQEVYGNN